jgi:hypothetical protein
MPSQGAPLGGSARAMEYATYVSHLSMAMLIFLQRRRYTVFRPIYVHGRVRKEAF